MSSSIQIVYGVDFTSAPCLRKPITVAVGHVQSSILTIAHVDKWATFDAFDAFLQMPGPWLAALDFPFGLPAEVVNAHGWGADWPAITREVATMGLPAFATALKRFRDSRLPGSKEPLRDTDRDSGSASAIKMVNPPVGRMYFQGAVRLLNAGVNIVPCHTVNDSRTVIEAYPALVARTFIGRRSYKSDSRNRQTPQRQAAREALIAHLCGSVLQESPYRLQLKLTEALAQHCLADASGDTLDSILAAVQAGYVVANPGYCDTIPHAIDRREGWIIDPTLIRAERVILPL